MDWDFLKGLLGIGGAVGGGLLSAEEYKRLGDIGEQSLAGVTLADGTKVPGAIGLAQDALSMSQFRPFTVSSAIPGSGFTATPTLDPTTGKITGTSTQFTLSPLEKRLQDQLLSQAETGFSVAGGAAGASDATSAGTALMTRGQTQLEQDPYGILNQQLLAGRSANLGGMFMGQLDQPMAGREADIYDRIRATQMPEEQRQRLALEERLANQGRLGVQTAMYGGTPEQLALSQAQEEAQNKASLAAIQQAQAEQAQQGALGAQFAELGSNLALSEGAMRDAQQKRAFESLLTGQGMFESGLGLKQAQQQLAMASLGGSYVPQTQLMQLQQAMQPYQTQAQAGQLFGAGQYGETMMSGLEARLVAEEARANLLGGLGTGLLGGLLGPVKGDAGTYKIPLFDILGGMF
tara:strand:- start:831 stop:2048 length:1218 start_codon:yes stop_codon:yes gene_type:complete